MRFMKSLAVVVFGLAVATGQAAAEALKPFILAEESTGKLDEVVSSVKKKLQANGFEVVGSYNPYRGVTVLAVTNDTLKREVAKSDFGGFGAAQRVAMTRADGKIQVTYTNPRYMAQAYRMQGNLDSVAQAMEAALGKSSYFGSESGVQAEELRKYQYKFLMPYFDDRIELAKYPDQKKALAGVEQALDDGDGGTSKVYRVDVPGSGETVFGVGMKLACSSDSYLMRQIDFGQVRSSAHLPYEILVKDGKVYTLPAEFRIAINFPDLSMVGKNGFASIMCAPRAIKNVLRMASGGEIVVEDEPSPY